MPHCWKLASLVVQRLAPDLEREAGAVSALAACRGVLMRIVRRVVAIVVVPAAARPLVALVASAQCDRGRAVAGDERRRRRRRGVAVVGDEPRVVGAGCARGPDEAEPEDELDDELRDVPTSRHLQVVAIDEHSSRGRAELVERLAASRNRASGAASAQSARRRENRVDDPVAIEDEHDELVGRVRVDASDEDEPAADRLGELHLGQAPSRS